MKRIESLVRPNIRAMVPYSTARDEFKGVAEVFMDANESPFDNGYNRYPDPSQAKLKRRIAEIKGVDVQNIFVGNGSDEAIDLCFRIFCNPGLDNAIAIAPSYGMYSTCAAVNDVEMREVLLNDDFSLPVERLLDAADNNSKLLFICSPNNPTGNVFPREEIERILQEFDGMVVLEITTSREKFIHAKNKFEENPIGNIPPESIGEMEIRKHGDNPSESTILINGIQLRMRIHPYIPLENE